MTRVKFLADKKGFYGFDISGHCSADGDDETGKTVCAAVSSAAYMAANTIIEVVGCNYSADIDEAHMRFTVKNPDSIALAVLKGFKLHIEQLAGQYDSNIKIYGGAEDVKD